jgi:glycerol-3-phosphate acyltransferase PlsY
MMAWYLILLVAYMLGSIPFGYILVRAATGADIRKAGSGNIGATNAFRSNKAIGLLTLLADGGKGYLAVTVASWLGGNMDWQAAAAVAAIAGHVFTVWLRFRGGKGVATGCGSYLALSPVAVGITLIVFVATALLTRYVSLASILATAAFPFWVYLRGEPTPLLVGALAGSLLIIVKHHQNIRRLLSGTETRFSLAGRLRN